MNQKNPKSNLEARIESLSDGAKTAIVLCANAFRFGGNWGFVKDTNPEFRVIVQTLSLERPHVQLLKVSNGALILCNEKFLSFNVNAVVPNAINGKFVDMANKRRNDEKALFNKFIGNVTAGKSRYIKKKNGFYEIAIGIFSVNDTNRITVNNVDYPAYKLSLIEALDYARNIARTGKKVLAKGVLESGEETYIDLANLAFNSKAATALYKGLEIADSDTGVFLTLRIA